MTMLRAPSRPRMSIPGPNFVLTADEMARFVVRELDKYMVYPEFPARLNVSSPFRREHLPEIGLDRQEFRFTDGSRTELQHIVIPLKFESRSLTAFRVENEWLKPSALRLARRLVASQFETRAVGCRDLPVEPLENAARAMYEGLSVKVALVWDPDNAYYLSTVEGLFAVTPHRPLHDG